MQPSGTTGYSVILEPSFDTEALEFAAALVAGLRGSTLEETLQLFPSGKAVVVGNGVSKSRAEELTNIFGGIGLSCEVKEGDTSGEYAAEDPAQLAPGTDLLQPSEQSSEGESAPEL